MDFAARAQVADEIPVERGLHLAAGLRLRGAGRRLHGPPDLLVEERVAGELGDGVVHPERELAGPARAVVEREHLPEEGLALRRLGADHLSPTELELDPGNPPPRVAR